MQKLGTKQNWPNLLLLSSLQKSKTSFDKDKMLKRQNLQEIIQTAVIRHVLPQAQRSYIFDQGYDLATFILFHSKVSKNSIILSFRIEIKKKRL